MRESDLLAHIYQRTRDMARRHPHVLVGPGDDCAVIRTQSGDSLLLTVDHLVEGRHFEKLDPADARAMIGTPNAPGILNLIARKAIARSISDIAAMGGRPSATLATACLPPAFPQAAADALFDAMHQWAAHWNAPLVGGDIATISRDQPGPLMLTTTVIGTPHPTRGPILRSGAKPGDGVYVTGRLGGSLRSGRHMSFEPRIEEGAWIAGLEGTTAMIDVSDGLGRDAARIGRASGVVIEIEAELLPLHEGVDWRQGAAEGEDYELLFTAGGEGMKPRAENGTIVTRIGRVAAVAKEMNEADSASQEIRAVFEYGGCVIRGKEGIMDAGEMGWEHGNS